MWKIKEKNTLNNGKCLNVQAKARQDRPTKKQNKTVRWDKWN